VHEQEERENAGNMSNTFKLSDYTQGQRGKIIRVRGEQHSRQRMSEMGFTRGIEVQVVKNAPLMDPIEYLLKGYHVSLRKEQAACILMDQPITEETTHE
jgi:Fe2+ transport system protein FeoA